MPDPPTEQQFHVMRQLRQLRHLEQTSRAGMLNDCSKPAQADTWQPGAGCFNLTYSWSVGFVELYQLCAQHDLCYSHDTYNLCSSYVTVYVYA